MEPLKDKERTGYYPERALADKIYRDRDNLACCRLHGIRLSGLSFGRTQKNVVADKKTEYGDNADRIEVKRFFSLAKRCYELGRIKTKIDSTTRSSIAMSILTMNVALLVALSLHQFLIMLFSRFKQHENMLIFMQNKGCEKLTTC